MPLTFPPPPRVNDPDMHHGTCVTHVPWCMPRSVTSGFLWSRRPGKAFPAFPARAQAAIYVSRQRPILSYSDATNLIGAHWNPFNTVEETKHFSHYGSAGSWNCNITCMYGHPGFNISRKSCVRIHRVSYLICWDDTIWELTHAYLTN